MISDVLFGLFWGVVLAGVAAAVLMAAELDTLATISVPVVIVLITALWIHDGAAKRKSA